MTSTSLVVRRIAELRTEAARFEAVQADPMGWCHCVLPGQPECATGFRFVPGGMTDAGTLGTSGVVQCGECAWACRYHPRCVAYRCSVHDGECHIYDRAVPDTGAVRDHMVCAALAGPE